jgi:ATP-dependent DNA ligase
MQSMKPMLCHTAPLVERQPIVPTGPEWVIEPKHDGIRFMIEMTDNGVRCYGGRNWRDHTGGAPGIERALAWLPPGTMLDGERIGTGGEYGYVAFDVLMCAGHDLRGLEWSERRKALEMIGRRMSGPVRINVYELASQEQYEAWVEQGLEGAVAKRTDSRYRSGKRSWDWQKCKPSYTAEARIVSFEMGRGKSNGHMVSSMTIRMLESGAMSSVGIGGEMAERALADPGSLIGRIVEIECGSIFEKTGVPRFPGFKRLRPDLEAA